jgi:histidinol-phosphate aminotransferase
MSENIFRKNILDIKPYVPGKPIDEVERELKIKNIIKLASNENPWGASPKALAALTQQINNIHLYPDGNAYYLKQSLAEQLSIQQDNIIIGNGSDELIKMIAETFINPGDEIIIPDPTFSEYEFAAKVMGGKAIKVKTKEFRIDLMTTLKQVTEKTKLVFICNPNNPTGTIVLKAELESFLSQLPEKIIVVFDEAYYEYVENENYVSGINYITQRENTIVLRTFSKIYGLAGLRIGYGIANKRLIGLINRVREPFNTNSLAQVAAVASLNDDAYREKCKELNLLGKQWLYQELEKLKLNYIPSETNFVLIDVKRDASVIYEKLLKEGVIIRSCASFGLPNYIRVTIGKPEENLRFIQTLTTAMFE